MLKFSLGISNKKDLIPQMINDNKIDILCLREVELDQNMPKNVMSMKDFIIEVEANCGDNP